jgi:hypothetical protein
MIPKEKAKELMAKFNNYHDIEKNEYIIYQSLEETKRCSLLAVDLHLEELSKMKLIFSDREIHCKYWQEVKNEINQLITKNK